MICTTVGKPFPSGTTPPDNSTPLDSENVSVVAIAGRDFHGLIARRDLTAGFVPKRDLHVTVWCHEELRMRHDGRNESTAVGASLNFGRRC